jgi:hypothetical protein
MDITAPEALNRRLTNTTFLSNVADRGYFMQLLALVNGLARTTDNLTLPDINEAGAWPKLFGLYTSLKRRNTDEPHINPEVVAQASKAAAQRTLWSNYVEARQRLEVYSKREPSWRILAEFCALQESDLDAPEDKGGELYPAWRTVAGRVSHALSTIERLTPSERERIPAVLRQRRADAGAISMAQRIAELERALKHAKELVENHGQ